MNEINLKNGGGTEQYLRPQMEVIDLSGEDVIVTSGSSSDSSGAPDAPWWSGEGD